MMPSQPIQILLVEDDDVDATTIYRLLRPHAETLLITRVTDGQQALDCLHGTGGQQRLPRPYLILLDLQLPMLDGLAFLHELRADPQLQPSSVFVISASQAEADKAAAYRYGIVAYLAKESLRNRGDAFVQLVYWYSQIAELLPQA
ncbi:MAG: response regulator [Caldilineaceae bacterium]|nr:response regulator [Caldilineaceae bacterium]